jgi:membrane protein implicated in regulation of membrane protease activity
MDAWILWVVAAAVLGVGEMHTGGFFLAPFAVGALVAAGVSLAGGGAVVGAVVFVAIAVASLAALRPLAVRHQTQTPLLRTGTAALVGKSGLVLERIGGDDHFAGRVKIGGEVWTARGYDEDHIIEPGAKVQVVEIRGATALVIE